MYHYLMQDMFFNNKSKSHRIHVWYIYLHLPTFTIMVNVGKYTIHGSCGNMVNVGKYTIHGSCGNGRGPIYALLGGWA